MTLSVMITTKNRVEDLKRTTRVLAELDPGPQEILITADGCTDGTASLVKSELPDAKLIVNEQARGSVASRDRMMREAQGDLVLALDDDSYPEQLDCIPRIVRLFENGPELAVLHFPQRTDEYPETITQPNFDPEHLTRSFANSGAVLRRSTYLELPGFESLFFHMYEEPDYALQCVAAGYEVLFSPVVTIRHHYSGEVRSELRNHHRHARNELWSVLLRCPFPYVVPVAIYRAATQFGYAWHRGGRWLLREPLWWWSALKGFPWLFRKRQPVHWSAYKKWMSLR
jgi:GT2 family glycosyltransferase